MCEWRQVRIGDFLSERKGKFKPGTGAIEGLQRVDKIDFSGNIHLSNKDSKTDLIIVCPGDLLISGINVAKGAVAVYYGDNPVVASIHYSSYTFDEKLVSIEYFRRFVRSPLFDDILKEQVRGGIKTEIKAKDFLPLQIHLPDLDTQNEIVANFENIENEISDIAGEANHQASLIKQLRQAVLQDVVEGKLTADWRRQHPVVKGDPQHDAAALLAQIKAEKERLVKAGEIRQEKPLPPITDSDKPFELPEGWKWCRLGGLLESTFYGPRFGKDEYKSEGIPTIRTTDMRNGKIVLKNPPKIYLKDEKAIETYKLNKYDILITRTGSIGEYAVFDDEYLAMPSAYLIRCRLVDTKCISFLLKLIASPLTQAHFGLNTQTGTKPNINASVIESTFVPLPPLAEQQAIVARVDSLMATIDALQAQVTERKEQAQLLMQAVLREAFAGE